MYGLPMAGSDVVCPLLETLGFPEMPGLPEAGTDHRSMSHGPGPEAMMNFRKWIPLVLITAIVLTVLWMTMMYIVVLYVLFGGGL